MLWSTVWGVLHLRRLTLHAFVNVATVGTGPRYTCTPEWGWTRHGTAAALTRACHVRCTALPTRREPTVMRALA